MNLQEIAAVCVTDRRWQRGRRRALGWGKKKHSYTERERERERENRSRRGKHSGIEEPPQLGTFGSSNTKHTHTHKV
jgi:hypothetical protein